MQGERRLLPAAKGVAISHSLSTIVVVDLFVSTDCCFLHSVLAGQVGGSTAHVPPPTCEMMILQYNVIVIMTPPTCVALSTIAAAPHILVSVPGQR